MNKLRISLVLVTVLTAGCSLDPVEEFTGAWCGTETEAVKGVLGNAGLADIQTLDASQQAKYEKQHRCPDTYDFCVHPQSGKVVDETSVLCSLCDQGQLMCNAESGGLKCIPVLNDKQNCGGCGVKCDDVCENGVCIQKESDCGNDSISCEVTAEDGTKKSVCINPLSDNSCGATCENPDGDKCDADHTCFDNQCKCKDNKADCNGTCVDLNDDATCGSSCDNIISCNTSENQHCQNGTCACPDGLLFREGHCIDPMRNNKYCGADDAKHTNGSVCAIENGLICMDGYCKCKDGYLRVKNSEKCVDPKTDLDYCGAVDVDGFAVKPDACFKGQECINGSCECPELYHKTINGCVKNDETTCGAKGNASDSDPRSKDYKGYKCGNDDDFVCRWWAYDPDNRTDIELCTRASVDSPDCGDPKYEVYQDSPCNHEDDLFWCANPNRVVSCTNTCNGKTIETSCKCKEGLCGRLCTDTLNDDNNCGSCGNKCPANAHCANISGEYGCECNDGYAPKLNAGMTAECINVENDRNNCGSVDHKCEADEICVNSNCTKCSASQTQCLDMCIENFDALSSDSDLLSFEDRKIQSCSTEKLECMAGYANCNAESFGPFDGCETPLNTQTNCGACGNACSRLTTCNGEKCCMSSEVEYTEETEGEYLNAFCCSETESVKCQKTVTLNGKPRIVYHCRKQCEVDETEATLP